MERSSRGATAGFRNAQSGLKTGVASGVDPCVFCNPEPRKTIDRQRGASLFDALLNLLILAVVIFAVARFIPAIHIKGFGTAILVAIVYSLINFFFGRLLYFITYPLIFITFGLFKIVINAVLLWVTDKLIPDFEIKGFGWTLAAAFLIAAADTLLGRILG
ncbi:MAG: hypothetical protein GF344_04645 [Chitinivibrionales bacterium]|nr:hypothetical protein [Chitinivibrionales bacterium]MBD3356311.1 hypothetical protein [Chitinivibrionales bacterium]